jgi:3-dehydroquinate synthase
VIGTLPEAHRRAGLAEAIKHGVVADAGHFSELDGSIGHLVAADIDALLDAVVRSVEIKASVVRDDIREGGRRKILNFGHTLGHAIEHASGYALLHGECVAIGMVLESRLAERLGVAQPGTADAVESILVRTGLPVKRPAGMDPDVILDSTRLDKKARRGGVEYALPERIGMMAEAGGAWSMAVDDALVREVLR